MCNATSSGAEPHVLLVLLFPLLLLVVFFFSRSEGGKIVQSYHVCACVRVEQNATEAAHGSVELGGLQSWAVQ